MQRASSGALPACASICNPAELYEGQGLYAQKDVLYGVERLCRRSGRARNHEASNTDDAADYPGSAVLARWGGMQTRFLTACATFRGGRYMLSRPLDHGDLVKDMLFSRDLPAEDFARCVPFLWAMAAVPGRTTQSAK